MTHYWLPDATSGTGTGNWGAVGATGHWADDATGTNLGKAAPGVGDDVVFGASSFNNTGQTVTEDGGGSCLGLDWSGATLGPTFTVSATLAIYGSVTLIPGMTVLGAGSWRPQPAVSATFTSAGKTLGSFLKMGAGSLTLLDALTSASYVDLEAGTLVTNGYAVTTGTDKMYLGEGAAAKTLTLGASVITSPTGCEYNGSNLTFNSGTSSIRISGTGTFVGGGLTFHEVQLNGTAHTVSGNNTLSDLRFKPAGTQTITWSGTPLFSVASMGRTGVGVITFVGAQTITKTGGGVVRMWKTSIADSTVSPSTKTFYAGLGSTDGGGNTGWIFGNPPYPNTVNKLMAGVM